MEIKSLEIADYNGSRLPNQLVYLYVPGTKTIVAGIETAAGVPMNNPFRADSAGRVEFGAPNGEYDLSFTSRGRRYLLRLVFFDNDVADYVVPSDFGAVGDGLTNDTAAFASLESAVTGTMIDLKGKTYLVDDFPSGNFYINGNFKRSSDSQTVQSEYFGYTRSGNSNVLIGRSVAKNLTPYAIYKTGPRGYGLTAVGDKCMGQAGDEAYNCSAYGSGALFNNKFARYNDAFGLEALYYTLGVSGSTTSGTRNASFGANSMRFNTQGRSNVAMGRNANQIGTTADFNTFIGAGAGAGVAPLDISGAIINPYPRTAGEQCGVGTSALDSSNGAGNTAFGYSAGASVKLGTGVVAVGHNALSMLESGVSHLGNQLIVAPLSGTWTQVGTLLTFTMLGHGMSAGFISKMVMVGATLSAGDPQEIVVGATLDANTWTAVAPDSATRSGTCTRSVYANLTPVAPTTDNMAVGHESMSLATTGSNNCAGGSYTLRANTGSSNSAWGILALRDNTSGTQNTASGYSALRANTTGGQNSAYGEFSLGNLTSGSNNTAVGRSSLRAMQDASPATNLSNCTGVGVDSRVSGNNQVQLGSSSTTTYVYGTVQNRSDRRDKADIEDTELGLDFILGLRPVSGRWDMREDYIEVYQEQDGVDEAGKPIMVDRVRILPMDGSKKRNRLHQWLIAQDVEELCKKLGVEFGGLQHHAVNGGCDVYSLGYDEFVPPLIKSVHQIHAKVAAVEESVKLLHEKVDAMLLKLEEIDSRAGGL